MCREEMRDTVCQRGKKEALPLTCLAGCHGSKGEGEGEGRG